jgi:flagellar biogenesis protein FliO
VFAAGTVHAAELEGTAEPAANSTDASSEFEATEPPTVTLEEPESLERTGEPTTAEAPSDVSPASAVDDAPVPDWWTENQPSLDRAIRERSDASTEEAAPTDPAAPQDNAPRTLGRSILQGIIALCVVVALIVLSTYAVRRVGARTPLLAGASLGTVLGKVYLTPKIALHFVKVRNVVLVLGVTPTGVSSVAQLSAALFDDIAQPATKVANDNRQMDFLSHLTSATGQTPALMPEREVDEIAALKGDIARLQQYLQETSRELDD